MSPRPVTVSKFAPLYTAAILLLVAVTVAPAQAGAPFCALRDPSHQIYDMFPTATGYRSVVRDIDNEIQVAVDEQIPFPLLQGELGQHTLYVPVSDDRPLGYIQIRSELTEWGLAEIVWALDKQLNIVDFRFQRCRGRACRTVLGKGLVELVHDKDQAALVALLDAEGNLLSDQTQAMNESERTLAAVVIRSAVKVIAVIESGWASTVRELGKDPAT